MNKCPVQHKPQDLHRSLAWEAFVSLIPVILDIIAEYTGTGNRAFQGQLTGSWRSCVRGAGEYNGLASRWNQPGSRFFESVESRDYDK